MVLLTSKRNKYDSYSLAHDGGYNFAEVLWVNLGAATETSAVMMESGGSEER